ncbi:hypothetical protein K7X08_015695 [Anisodus acutangulus]|uniref:Uncharacterized protein n=1 Tax=Anisodus acutangulus TaxID=402998 RepID=A0A9Q1QXB7_9SOLA|nr:hypothetical protein K7X08_015695 [Anisodus acutangulus]
MKKGGFGDSFGDSFLQFAISNGVEITLLFCSFLGSESLRQVRIRNFRFKGEEYLISTTSLGGMFISDAVR